MAAKSHKNNPLDYLNGRFCIEVNPDLIFASIWKDFYIVIQWLCHFKEAFKVKLK